METNTQRLDRHQSNGETEGGREVASVVLMGMAVAGGALAMLVLALLP